MFENLPKTRHAHANITQYNKQVTAVVRETVTVDHGLSVVIV